ncbi:MAG: YjjG family noncanonical pyrimidine nucleotidase [Bacillota bacterium]
MHYRLVLLDADDTLFDYQRGMAAALPALYLRLGLSWDPDKDLKRFSVANEEVWRELREGRITYGDLKVERFRRLFAGQPMDFPAVSRLFLSLLVEYAFIMDGAEEICRYLSSSSTLAVVTNGLPEIQRPRIRQSPLSRYIPEERVYIAEEVGFRKPDARFFEHVFADIGHSDKSTAIMIGDSQAEDIRGGANFGIDTCWLDRTGSSCLPGVSPTLTVRSLHELIGKL